MNPEQLLAHFERISEAPDVIPRLRQFILELAVRGKLAEQDPGDETASELLKRIQAEKTRLVKAGEIKQEKRLPLVAPDEPAFGAPPGWEWVRIRQATSDRGQTVPSKDFTYIDVTAINKEAGSVADPKILSAEEAPSRARKVVQKGDVLYSCVRPYLLNIAIIESDFVPSPIASTAFAVLNGLGLVLPRYLWIALRSPFMVNQVETKMRGQAYPAISDSDFSLLPLPLPPLTEQHRIVSNVDELMALCERLEAAQAERESRRDRLMVATLQRLSQPVDEDATMARVNTRFYLRHLPRLTTRPEQIQQLRETVLNLAIRGRLVPQDSEDVSASELLRKIQKEKACLAKESNARERKQRQVKVDIDEFFNIPATWIWTSLGDLAFGFRYGTSVKCSYEPIGEPVLRIPNIDNGRINIEDLKFGPLSPSEAHDLRLQLGDILMVRSNGSLNLVGRPALVEAHAIGFCYAGYLVRVRTSVIHLDPRYLLLALNTTHVRDQIEVPVRTTVGLKNLNVTELSCLTIPLPPFSEQHRIVAKVNELMVLCDHLETQLTTTQTESRRLLEAVLHEALNSAA